MNKIKNRFSLARDKFMLEIDLRQPGFDYIACGPITKNKKRIQKKKIRKSKDIQNTFIKNN